MIRVLDDGVDDTSILLAPVFTDRLGRFYLEILI
jgi:hypothetical protein